MIPGEWQVACLNMHRRDWAETEAAGLSPSPAQSAKAWPSRDTLYREDGSRVSTVNQRVACSSKCSVWSYVGALRLSALNSGTEQGINIQGPRGCSWGGGTDPNFLVIIVVIVFLLVPITAYEGSGLLPRAKLASLENPVPQAVRIAKLLHGLKFVFWH